MAATFYRTTYTVAVFSEEIIPDHLDLEGVLREADLGVYVASVGRGKDVEIDPAETAQGLIEAGSDPGFFGIIEHVTHSGGVGWHVNDENGE